MAKTYKVEGYIVDVKGDDLNRLDFFDIFRDNFDLTHNVELTESPTWEWSYDCPENSPWCTREEFERRFKHGTDD